METRDRKKEKKKHGDSEIKVRKDKGEKRNKR